MLGLCLTFAALTHQSLEISMLLVVVQFYFSVEVATGLMSLSSPEMERPIMMSQGFPLSEIYMYKEGGGGAQFQTKNPPTPYPPTTPFKFRPSVHYHTSLPSGKSIIQLLPESKNSWWSIFVIWDV